MNATEAPVFPFPQAWTPSDFKSIDDVSQRLGESEIAALEERLAAVKRAGAALQDITRDDFRHEALDGMLAAVQRELLYGRGIVVLRGLPVDRYSADDMAMMYWGIGAHFGTGVSQSALGDVLGHVVDLTKPGEPEEARGYTTSWELNLHSDLAQLVGLFCYRQAGEGGVSLVANALTIHNEFAANHPELLPVLYRGFHYHRRGEEAPDAPEITPYPVPVFSEKDGYVSAFYVRSILENAYEPPYEPLSDEQVEALDRYDEYARKHCYRLRLEPGDALFLNNRTTMHARTRFLNGDMPGEQRHLMRLWLDTPGERPAVPEIQIYENEGGRSGIDYQEGRGRASAKYHKPQAAE